MSTEFPPPDARLADKLKVLQLSPHRSVLRVASSEGNGLSARPRKKSELVSLATVSPRATDWLWRSRIPRGALIISTGLPGVGKSQQLIDRIARITTGLPWPDGSSCPHGSTILLTAEDTLAHTVVPRLLAAGANLARVFTLPLIHVDERTRRAFLLTEDLDELERHLVEHPEIIYVGIDPVTAYIGYGKIDSHKATDIRGVLGPLVALAERQHVAIEIVTHPPKASTSAINAFIGSQAFIAAARLGYLTVAEVDDEGDPTGRYLLTMVKTNIGPKMPTLAYRLEQVVVGQDERDKRDIIGSRIVWDSEPVKITADAALAAATSSGRASEPTAKDEAVDFLRTVLADRPIRVADLEREARDAGLLEVGVTLGHSKPFRAARKALGIETKKLGMAEGWVWSLPKMPSAPEDALQKLRAPSAGEGTFEEPKATPRPPSVSAPPHCDHCKESGGDLSKYEITTADGRTVKVILHVLCKRAFYEALGGVVA